MDEMVKILWRRNDSGEWRFYNAAALGVRVPVVPGKYLVMVVETTGDVQTRIVHVTRVGVL